MPTGRKRAARWCEEAGLERQKKTPQSEKEEQEILLPFSLPTTTAARLCYTHLLRLLWLGCQGKEEEEDLFLLLLPSILSSSLFLSLRFLLHCLAAAAAQSPPPHTYVRGTCMARPPTPRTTTCTTTATFVAGTFSAALSFVSRPSLVIYFSHQREGKRS